jgi:nitrite reductase (cytochrome c-552)
MPLYRELGNGDAMKGFESTYAMSYQDASAKLHDSGHAHPVSCVDCHVPNTMELRVTGPGFVRGIQARAASDAEVPHLPSIQEWRKGSRSKPYDPNEDATRGEMRSFVCGQCHVEYYCSSKMTLTFPWGDGLTADQVESSGTTRSSPTAPRSATTRTLRRRRSSRRSIRSSSCGARASTRAQRRVVLDCHMPYMRDGATRSRPLVRSPPERQPRVSGLPPLPEEELKARVDAIQSRNHELMERAGAALMDQLDAMVQRRRTARAMISSPARARCTAKHSGGSTSSRPRTRWGSTRRKKPRACSAKPPTMHGRARSPR